MSAPDALFTARLNLHPPLEVLHLPAGDVWIQRDDLIHPVISGNKWRKLQGHLHRMETEGKRILVTFGGAYSNHLVAAAVAAELSGVRCIGILRGDEPLDNHYLRVARAAGMEVIGVSRSLYRDKLEALSVVLGDQGLSEEAVFVVGEGGVGELGLVGFGDLIGTWLSLDLQMKAVFHASATGTTAVGLRCALNDAIAGGLLNWDGVDVHPVLVLKNLEEQRAFAALMGLADGALKWELGYEWGGYARGDDRLDEFVESVMGANEMPFEPIYTGKALFGLNEWLKGKVLRDEIEAVNGVYPVVFLHTGGTLNVRG
jgi:1-aminocyclopropane-1-carboxylate deaminase